MKFEVKGQEIEHGDFVLIKGNSSSGYVFGRAEGIVKKERKKKYFFPDELRNSHERKQLSFEPSEYLTLMGTSYQLTATNFFGKRIAGFDERKPKKGEDTGNYAIRTIEQIIVGKENIVSFLEGHEDKIYSGHAREIREVRQDSL